MALQEMLSPSHLLIFGWSPKCEAGQRSRICVKKGKYLQNIMTSHKKKVLLNPSSPVADITDGEVLPRTEGSQIRNFH